MKIETEEPKKESREYPYLATRKSNDEIVIISKHDGIFYINYLDGSISLIGHREDYTPLPKGYKVILTQD